ncbi:hypothetical protein C8J57DRAFT_1512193 [Mycena rebaudengoi]|nr:hypothetical protein C8J57DRAFT_1512193 [Mycena rebaudengoi]
MSHLRPCIHAGALALRVWDHLLDEAHAVLPRLVQDAEVHAMARFLDLTSGSNSPLSALRRSPRPPKPIPQSLLPCTSPLVPLTPAEKKDEDDVASHITQPLSFAVTRSLRS